MGGIRGVYHYMQRTALQGAPTALTGIVKEFMPGAAVKTTAHAGPAELLKVTVPVVGNGRLPSVTSTAE